MIPRHSFFESSLFYCPLYFRLQTLFAIQPLVSNDDIACFHFQNWLSLKRTYRETSISTMPTGEDNIHERNGYEMLAVEPTPLSSEHPAPGRCSPPTAPGRGVLTLPRLARLLGHLATHGKRPSKERQKSSKRRRIDWWLRPPHPVSLSPAPHPCQQHETGPL